MADEPTNRRLSDKLKSAFEQALRTGRKGIAERIELIYQAVMDEDLKHSGDRRRSSRP